MICDELVSKFIIFAIIIIIIFFLFFFFTFCYNITTNFKIQMYVIGIFLKFNFFNLKTTKIKKIRV